MKNGEEQGFTADEFKAAQTEGWEKQYQYKVGKKKVYMTASAAKGKGYERVSKYPKSTKYGRQNPIAERWSSEEQLVLWRAAWADVTNRHLEQYGHDERIDHRSHAEREFDEQPTIHEGVVARALEKKGIASDRCELNRQIKADNALLRELRRQVKKLAQGAQNTLPALDEAMENLRKNLLLFFYQLGYLRKGKERLSISLNTLRSVLTQYSQLTKDIRDKTKERRSLLSEKKSLSAVHVFRHRELAAKIAILTEDLEEQAQGFDPVQLYEAKQAIRPGKEQEAQNRAQQVYGEKFSPLLMFDSQKEISRMLNEEAERQAVRRMVQQAQKIPNNKKNKGQDR